MKHDLTIKPDDLKNMALRAKPLPFFYACSICDCYHRHNWNGDCRDDANRFVVHELDEAYGPSGWKEVPAPDF